MANRVHRTANAFFPKNNEQFEIQTANRWTVRTSNNSNNEQFTLDEQFFFFCSLDPDLLMVFTAEPTLHVKVQTELSDAQVTLNK